MKNKQGFEIHKDTVTSAGQALKQQQADHKKELEVADERWKSNEKYRERYMEDLIEKIESKSIIHTKDIKEFHPQTFRETKDWLIKIIQEK